VSRTNIDLDDDLRRLVGDKLSREEALGMEGSGWDAGLAELRGDRAAELHSPI
jgi:Arc/MetJ family transcription regulator